MSDFFYSSLKIGYYKYHDKSANKAFIEKLVNILQEELLGKVINSDPE
jgi:hypothetical protein